MVTATTAGGAPLDVWANLDAIRQRIAAMRTPFLAADFDGTLAPIVNVPALAVLPRELKPVLRALAAADVITIIISGRAIDDLQPRVGLPLIYAGNHGLEIRGAGLEYTVPAAHELRYELLTVCNRLRAGLAPFAGALVECKRLSASVHFRQVDRREVPAVAGVVQSTLERHSAFRVSIGKEVLEIRPNVSWNKGSAVRWVLERVGGKERDAICIGDDATDEDMFRELRAGITVRVGADHSSCAQYRVGEHETLRFLGFVRGAVNESRRTHEVTYGGSGQQDMGRGL